MSQTPHIAEPARQATISDQPEFTVVNAIDARYLEQAKQTMPVWRAGAKMHRRPTLVFVCAEGPGAVDIEEVKKLYTFHRDVRYESWPNPLWSSAESYRSQRELMLSAFCHAHRFVETEYMLKIDVDSMPKRITKADEYAAYSLFNWYANRNTGEPQQPAIVASPWGYTKPGEQMFVLDEWANELPGIRETPPLGFEIPLDDDGQPKRKLVHPRICSWFCFINTAFATEAAQYTAPGSIPVPSQDGFHWYMAARLGWHVTRTNFKRRGWTVVNGLRRVKETATLSFATIKEQRK